MPLQHNHRHDADGSLLRGEPGRYLWNWTHYQSNGGMSSWCDIVDWVGGYPYTYASTEALMEFFGDRGFEPQNAKPGCNEIVFVRETPA